MSTGARCGPALGTPEKNITDPLYLQSHESTHVGRLTSRMHRASLLIAVLSPSSKLARCVACMFYFSDCADRWLLPQGSHRRKIYQFFGNLTRNKRGNNRPVWPAGEGHSVVLISFFERGVRASMLEQYTPSPRIVHFYTAFSAYFSLFSVESGCG